MSAGRPKGTYKYKDEAGNLISVFEWKKLYGITNKLQSHVKLRQRIITIIIPKEYKKILNYLCEKHQMRKENLAEKIILRYFDKQKEKLNII